MVAQPAEIAARLAVIKALARLGQFEDDGRPMSEAEYRHSFKRLTYGCTDEDIAQFWYANLKYEGPAFFWYHELGSTPEGRVAAGKWSTLEPVIEERWNTPPINLKAFRQRTRKEWRDRKFIIEDMLDQLRDPGAKAKPHFAWAAQHRVLGKQVNTSNEDRVWNTLNLLPRYVVNLLPKVDLYEDDFEGLMSDIGAISSSSLLHAHSTWSALELIRSQVAQHKAQAQAQAHFQTPHVMPKREPSTQQPYAPATKPADTLTTKRDCHKPLTARQPNQIPISTPSTAAPALLGTYKRTTGTSTSQREPAASRPAPDCNPSNGQTRELGIDPGKHRQDRERRTPEGTSPRRGKVDLSGVEEIAARQWPMKLQVLVVKGDSWARQKVWATIDGGAMLCVLDSVLWAQFEHFVGKLRPSQVVCRMANGTRVPSMGTAEVEIEYGEHRWPAVFEVMDSNGAFELLIGKDWLNSTGARQDYLTDTISLRSADKTIYIGNQNPVHPVPTPALPPQPVHPQPKLNKIEPVPEPVPEPEPEPTNKREHEAQPEPNESTPTRAATPPSATRAAEEPPPGEQPRRSKRIRNRERRARPIYYMDGVQLAKLARMTGMRLDLDKDEEPGSLEEARERAALEAEEERQRAMFAVEVEQPKGHTNPLREIVKRARRTTKRRAATKDPEPVESERTKDPFNPQQVAEILGKIQIGKDLSEEQTLKVKSLVEMKLDVPEGTTFPKQAGQRKMTKPQYQALYATLDELEEAQIIKKVTQDQVAAVSPINMGVSQIRIAH
ncbi:unnamed protein product [Rhizoctonia solani]|uniref:Uncharacterized protein n=1 Tax=Rhizoctonia solani TaxID=456999 RepID=A0A8H3HFT0_9AGAM|nr:unnamed protein product [Rhizoctonia solani]